VVRAGGSAAQRSLQQAANFRGRGRQALTQSYLTAGGKVLEGAGTLLRRRDG
jgi:hypothetical protein